LQLPGPEVSPKSRGALDTSSAAGIAGNFGSNLNEG